jgi:hypothetical protein
MQSSLPAEPTRRNIKAADVADSAKVAEIVEIELERTPRIGAVRGCRRCS